MRKQGLFILLLLMSFCSMMRAQTSFTYGGLNYTVLSEADATAIVGKQDASLSGDVIIGTTAVDLSTDVKYTVVAVGDEAFSGCAGLTSLVIPAGVSSIGQNALANCTGLKWVVVKDGVSDIAVGADTFSGMPATTILYVPAGKLSEFANNSVWKIFKSIIQDDNITFADSNVKSVCVNNWDTNEDGELSLVEALMVTSLGQKFWGNTYIISFKELQYFRSLNTLNDDFRDCSNLVDIKFPNSVKNIEDRTFKGCNKLTLADGLPENLENIGLYAFKECYNLGDIYIPETVTNIDHRAFRESNPLSLAVAPDNAIYDSRNNCNAIIQKSDDGLLAGCSKTVIPEDVKYLHWYSFSGRIGLESIFIPSSVISMGGGVFLGCSDLATITVDAGNPVFDSRNNCNAIIETSTNKLLYGCKNTVIPNSVASIGEAAFRGYSGLTSIVIPSSVTSIGNSAFDACSSLTSVTCKSSTPPSLGESVFSGTPTSTLYVPAGSKAAYAAASVWNEFKEIIEIENITFADSKVKEICVANWDTNGDGELSNAEAAAVTSLGKIFEGNTEIVSFDELQYFTGLTSINEYAFLDCSNLSSLKIPNSVTNFGVACFRGCWKLQTLTIPNSVTTLNDKIFYDCGIKSITIPQSVKSIGISLFKNCPDLTTIIVEEGNPIYDSRDNCNAIIETSSNTLIASCKNTVIPQTVTTIGEAAFLYCSGLTSIVVPNNVLSIKGAAFRDCYDLTSVTLPNAITNIDTLTFWGCHVLESIIIPRSVKSIGDRAFGRCLQLKSVVIPSSTTTISSNAFVFCN